MLNGYPTGDAADWRARYEPVIERELGEPVEDAVFTAVVVTWEGGAASMGDCLSAIARAAENFDQPVEVLVVDNAAPTQLADELAGLWDRWVRFEKNLQLSPARNLGVVLASADIVGFVDDDGLVADDYFTNALPYFDDPDVVAIRGRVAPREHPYFTTLAIHYDRGTSPVDDALVTEGASFVRRQSYVDAGGFPDEIMGHEGIALSYRLQNTRPDGRTLYVPDVVLHHDYLDSWQAFFKKVTGYSDSAQQFTHRSPEVARFMKEFFARSYPRRKLTIKEELARTGLRALRTALRGGVKLKSLIDKANP